MGLKVIDISHTYITKMSQAKVQALAECVDSLTVVTPRRVKDTLRTIELECLEDSKFKLIGIDSCLGFHHSFRIYPFRKLYKIIDEVRPDVVIVEQEPFSFSTWQIFRLKKKFGFKTIIVSNQNLNKKYPFPFSWIESFCLRNTDLYLGVTESVTRVWAAKGMPKDKLAVLAQVGVSPEQFKVDRPEHWRKQYGVSKFAFGYAGRFVEEKGIQVLIEAFSRARISNVAELVLIGGGPYQERLEGLIERLGLQKSVKFVSGVKHHEMAAVLNAIDVLVLPSLIRPHWKEQFGHIIIEAQACGKPVLGSDCDPIPEVIGAGGLTFRTEDPVDCAAKLKTLVEDKDLYSTLSQAALQNVETRYSNKVVAETLLKMMNALVGSKNQNQ